MRFDELQRRNFILARTGTESNESYVGIEVKALNQHTKGEPRCNSHLGPILPLQVAAY